MDGPFRPPRHSDGYMVQCAGDVKLLPMSSNSLRLEVSEWQEQPGHEPIKIYASGNFTRDQIEMLMDQLRLFLEGKLV